MVGAAERLPQLLHRHSVNRVNSRFDSNFAQISPRFHSFLDGNYYPLSGRGRISVFEHPGLSVIRYPGSALSGASLPTHTQTNHTLTHPLPMTSVNLVFSEYIYFRFTQS